MNKFDKIDELKEIERKFKVNVTLMGFIGEIIPKNIVQGYIFSIPTLSTRVRRMDDKAFLTIKGGADLLSRDEFEYEIPVAEANEMLELFCKKILIKKRYVLVQDELCWEIDVFEGKLEGLILAEIELPAVDTSFSLPDWIGEEVTEDPQYLNANLIERC
ncbi:MAG: CYTH domain-containing protein [Crocinitomicaceae bacterium]|nr:CYTH domain-containing protein [Crocinitomicaceae bacterium]